MQLEYLEYLTAIHRAKSITKAAEQLGISQPALSTAVKNVENELGLTIFKRTTKGVQPTEQGLKILRDMENICEITAGWKTAETENERDIDGNVSLATTKSFNRAFFMDMFLQLKEAYPKLQLSIHEVARKEVSKYVSNNTSNIGCDLYLENHGAEEKELLRLGYEAEPLIQDHFVVVLSAEHPFAAKKTLGKQDLKQIPFAIYANHGDPIYQMACRNLGIQGSFFMDSTDVLQKLTESNQAFMLVPARTAKMHDSMLNGKTVMKEIEGFAMTMRYYCIHLPEEELSREERAFLQFLRDYFQRLRAEEQT